MQRAVVDILVLWHVGQNSAGDSAGYAKEAVYKAFSGASVALCTGTSVLALVYRKAPGLPLSFLPEDRGQVLEATRECGWR